MMSMARISSGARPEGRMGCPLLGMWRRVWRNGLEAARAWPTLPRMTALPVTELSTRAREIFRMVVESYLSSGQPVGSKTLSGGGALNLSPASIRSVLADLESLG